VADREIARGIWRDYRKDRQPINLDTAIEETGKSLEANPQRLKAEAYSQDKGLICPWCCESEWFPVADRSRVYDILGYL
jgi:hypothetical protein